MAWKKDLAKLKQALDKEETAPGKITPPPKPRTAHPISSSIEEEDNIFLNAMGLRPKPGDRGAALALQAEPAVALPKPAPTASRAEFSSAMGDLKGLKPLNPVIAPEPAPPAPAPEALVVPVPPPLPEPLPPPVPEKEPEPAGPPQVQINLAAGMAIVVDGSLDLKGHALGDAQERLKERILDGYALGWRTLHVLVGSSPELRQMVLDLLMSPAGKCVSRYAQAPVPMGGTQAWILYFRGPGAP